MARDKFGRRPYLRKIQVMLMMTSKFSSVDVAYEMNGHESRYIKEVLDWFREEDTRDLKRSELNQSIGSMTCLSVLKGKNWKSWKVGTVRKVTRAS